MSKQINRNHETILTIDLKALKNNLKYFKSNLKPSTKILAMVKAFGYGINHTIISKEIENQVDYLGVAFIYEALELRNAEIKTPILIMNPGKYSLEDLINYELEPSIFNVEQLNQIINNLNKLNKTEFPIHIKLDTGMQRLGFYEDEIVDLIKTLKNTKTIKVKGIFSHLAAADDFTQDDFTQEQLNKFNKISAQIENEIGYNTTKHILNTHGIERFSIEQNDMVRLGLGMYGVSNDNKIENVVTLKTKITQIKTVKFKSSVGYGRSEYVEESTLLGVIPIGYADGISRSLSNGVGHVLLHNQLVPIVGRVSMDMTIINLSKIPHTKIGDTVEIFGKNRTIQSFADELNTIPYEVLTSISHRILRKYI